MRNGPPTTSFGESVLGQKPTTKRELRQCFYPFQPITDCLVNKKVSGRIETIWTFLLAKKTGCSIHLLSQQQRSGCCARQDEFSSWAWKWAKSFGVCLCPWRKHTQYIIIYIYIYIDHATCTCIYIYMHIFYLKMTYISYYAVQIYIYTWLQCIRSSRISKLLRYVLQAYFKYNYSMQKECRFVFNVPFICIH